MNDAWPSSECIAGSHIRHVGRNPPSSNVTFAPNIGNPTSRMRRTTPLTVCPPRISAARVVPLRNIIESGFPTAICSRKIGMQFWRVRAGAVGGEGRDSYRLAMMRMLARVLMDTRICELAQRSSASRASPPAGEGSLHRGKAVAPDFLSDTVARPGGSRSAMSSDDRRSANRLSGTAGHRTTRVRIRRRVSVILRREITRGPPGVVRVTGQRGGSTSR